MTSCRPSRRTSFPSFGGTTVPPARFAPLRASAPRGLELVTRYLPPGFAVETTGSPTFLGNPRCAFALLSDPGRTSTSGHCDVSVLPPLAPRRRLQHGSFEAESHGLALAVYASWCELPRHHARLASAAGQALPEGLVTLWGSIERFQIPSSVTWHSPFPS